MSGQGQGQNQGMTKGQVILTLIVAFIEFAGVIIAALITTPSACVNDNGISDSNPYTQESSYSSPSDSCATTFETKDFPTMDPLESDEFPSNPEFPPEPDPPASSTPSATTPPISTTLSPPVTSTTPKTTHPTDTITEFLDTQEPLLEEPHTLYDDYDGGMVELYDNYSGVAYIYKDFLEEYYIGKTSKGKKICGWSFDFFSESENFSIFVMPVYDDMNYENELECVVWYDEYEYEYIGNVFAEIVENGDLKIEFNIYNTPLNFKYLTYIHVTRIVKS